MGQKVTPIGFRLGTTYKPQSQWFVDPRSGSMKKVYPPLVLEDRFIRDFIAQKVPQAAIAQILISRSLDYLKIEIHTAQAQKFSSQSSIKSSSGLASGASSAKHSGLKTLQQDLQIALSKYKKTLKIFASWKQSIKSKSNHSSNLNKTSSQTHSLESFEQVQGPSENEASQPPKLWSYEANDYPVKSQSHPQSLQEFEPKADNSTLPASSDSSQDADKSASSFSSPIEENESSLDSFSEGRRQPIGIVVKQVRSAYIHAPIFAKFLIRQLERRDTKVKQALDRSLKLIQDYNIQGIKVKVSGRLDGVDMAESKTISKGRIPLSTISAKIDYYQSIAQTLYGTLGVKVFIYR